MIVSSAVTGCIILLAVIVLYVTEVVPLAVTAVSGCLAMVWLQVSVTNLQIKDADGKVIETIIGGGAYAPATTWASAMSGFTSDSTWMVVGMVMVGAALFETGLADTMGLAIMKTIGASETKLTLIVFPIVMIMSAFLNNSATTATFMPIIQAIASTSGGKVSTKRMLMPLAFAATSGGMLTLVGSTPPVLVNAVLDKTEGVEPFGFFAFGIVGLPVCIVLILYCLTIAKGIANKIWKDEIEAEAASHTEVVVEQKTYDKGKMYKAGFILAFCVIGFILQGSVAAKFFTLGTVSTTGAMLTVILGCMSIKRLYELNDWNTFFVLAGAIGFAAALDKCGSGQLIADKTVALLGDASPFVIYAAFTLLGIILTQMMSNTATTAMMMPIGVAIAQGMGFSVLPLAMGLAAGCAAAYMTPVGTPPNTIVLGAGNYNFMDYVKMGTLYQVISAILIIIICPIFWPL
jgi:anion transporter